MRAPNRRDLDTAYAEWQTASEALAAIRDSKLHTEADEQRQLHVSEKLLQRYIELSQRFTATLN